MIFSRRSRVVAFALVLLGSAIWLALYQRARLARQSPEAMLARLPAQDAAILYLDFTALRSGGILRLVSQSKAAEEPEYQAFVRASGFDYRNDLDRAAAAFTSEGTFFVVKGRFDWKRLRAYAVAQGGDCDERLCRMSGSTPDRRISFCPLQSNLMALAVSSDASAARRIEDSPDSANQPFDPPHDPVWLSFSGGNLRGSRQLPGNTQLFAAALASADKILLSLGPESRQFEAKLLVTCRTAEDAASLRAQLQRTTSVLRDAITRENQRPNAKDLSGVLTAGVFEQAGRQVVGRWPLPAAFLESLAEGY